MEPNNNGHGNMFPGPPSLRASTTYVPSLVPPGVDPSQVDVRTFFPYQPNEVKHRKRTTRPQLKVLEDVYKYDKKPNASLRKKLADELGMLPRGVQVWFQNRRAKEKNLARKAEQVREGGAGVKKPVNLNASPAPESPSTAPESSSPTPVSSKPLKAGEASSSARTSPGSTATLPPATSSASSPSPTPAGLAPPPEESGIQQDEESPFVQSPPSREASVPSGYPSSTPPPSAAELQAQRRSSLPILSITPSASSPGRLPVRTTRASIHGGGTSGFLSASNGQPHAFDLPMRRRSVDMSAKRLGAHPYAHLARGTNDRFHGANLSHMHSLAPAANGDGASRLDSIQSAPGRIGLLRHGSMPHVLAPMDVPSRIQRRGNVMQEYNVDFPQGDLAPPRPTLAHKHSLPAFRESSQEFYLSPRSMSSGLSGSIFTNPNPFAPTLPAGTSPTFNYDTPVSPLASGAQPPPSPSSASPPPISQSLMHSYGHGMHVPSRIVQPPIPGPLPEPSFSFGDPSSSPSISSSVASSPPSDHSTVVDRPIRRDSADSVNSGGGPNGDDTSQDSSGYDALSRFGSFASVSSWTSYRSEPADAQAQKPETLEAPEGFDHARRGSFASTFLPQWMDRLEVADAGTAQPHSFANDGLSDQIPPEIAESRRGSIAQPEQAAYTPHLHDIYGGQNVYLTQDQFNYAPQEHHMPYPSTDQDPHASNGDVYAQMSETDIQQHVEAHHPLKMQPFRQSSSSELAYALHPQGNMQNNARFAVGYSDSASQGSVHPPTAPDQSAPFDSPSAETVHYGQESYEQQVTSYGSFTSEQRQTAYPEQQQPAYPEQQPTYPEEQLATYPEEQLTTYYDYGLHTGTPMYANGAVDLGSMCVPASIAMDGLGDYVQQYA
ncbi:uncharacterized protein PHACADRAFT_257545 [Phanerochaete carnosa HHB-10118-sp]|uniref:Homeobox domain-containing protein n=1 Tax=Phanerochaete carnosa (strain HHB-10118-sp) TaxID=650164 RepID=K5WU72_PHACS|nr:uncharacterized protein PHACADRAFT_257545 [Phanerochaete carnosa HHB-10118-sp]EKM53997.1 hypothetical protein PHACADRAFT_257545 [Phanerochaete carnosa HHB-10118-sp]